MITNELLILEEKIKEYENTMEIASKIFEETKKKKEELLNIKKETLEANAQVYVDAINDLLRLAREDGIDTRVTTQTCTYSYVFEKCHASCYSDCSKVTLYFSN